MEGELVQNHSVHEARSAEASAGLASERGADYAPLQLLLARQDFQAADQLTLQQMCEVAGPLSAKRGWLYFTDVEQFPATDLRTLNRLWLEATGGRFGFSVQREIWLSLGRDWERFWPQIGWKQGRQWTRYPQGFTWDLSAPKGHLPLSNQLRGSQVLASLLSHAAWQT